MARSRPVVDMARRMKMANLIRQKRLQAGLEQAELAEKIGVTPAAVGNWERCIARPDFDTVPMLCSVLRISATELLSLPPELGLNGEERDVLAAYRRIGPASRRTVRAMRNAPRRVPGKGHVTPTVVGFASRRARAYARHSIPPPAGAARILSRA